MHIDENKRSPILSYFRSKRKLTEIIFKHKVLVRLLEWFSKTDGM